MARTLTDVRHLVHTLTKVPAACHAGIVLDRLSFEFAAKVSRQRVQRHVHVAEACVAPFIRHL